MPSMDLGILVGRLSISFEYCLDTMSFADCLQPNMQQTSSSLHLGPVGYTTNLAEHTQAFWGKPGLTETHLAIEPGCSL